MADGGAEGRGRRAHPGGGGGEREAARRGASPHLQKCEAARSMSGCVDVLTTHATARACRRMLRVGGLLLVGKS
eukprot:782194-Rhodomonas_salina.1